MKSVILRTVQSEKVGDTTVELDKITRGYVVSIIKDKKIEKKWRINSSVVDKDKVAHYWYKYVLGELQQHVLSGIRGIPAVLKNATSGDAQDRIQSILDRI